MKRITAVLSGLLLLLGIAVFAAPAANAVPIVAPQMVWYDDHQGYPIRLTHKASDEISRSNVLDCSSSGTVKYLTLLDATRISALLFWVPSGATQCNYLWVENSLGVRWGACVGKLNWGYDFGPDFNDVTWLIGVKHSSACPAWANN